MAARCSFCSEPGSAVRPLVTGTGVAICGDCARLAVDVVDNAEPPSADVVLRDVGTLVTMDPRQGVEPLGLRHEVAVAVKRSRIVWIGDTVDIPEPYRSLSTFDCDGRVVLPGFVDAATRVVGGPRRERTDPEVLSDNATEIVRRMTARGVTALDIQVGGSDDPTVDTLELAVARAVADAATSTVTVTWRCAPDLPVPVVRDVMAPTVARLASSVAVTCRGDRSHLDQVLDALRRLRPVIVCEEPAPEACVPSWRHARAIEVRGVPPPADRIGGASIIVEWSRPGLALSVRAAGHRPALASFSHPEVRALTGMGVVLMAAVDLAGMDLPHALHAVTRGAGDALGVDGLGTVTLGGRGDLVVAEAETLDDLLLRPDDTMAWAVMLGGRLWGT